MRKHLSMASEAGAFPPRLPRRVAPPGGTKSQNARTGHSTDGRSTGEIRTSTLVRVAPSSPGSDRRVACYDPVVDIKDILACSVGLHAARKPIECSCVD